MERIKTWIKDNKADSLFIACALLFGALFGFAVIAYDDAYNMPLIGATIKEEIRYNLNSYHNWTSRILINTVWSIILEHVYYLYMIYMAISMYVLCKALYHIIPGEKDYKKAVFTVMVAMFFPFHLMTSAGWIATTGTYFGPQAFGIMALLPMGKIAKKEALSIKEVLWFSLCLLYGANFEQMCVALVFLYGVFCVWMLMEKNIRFETFLFLGLSVASLIFILTCPGNWGRSGEEAELFPTYGMLGFADKLELATSLTLKWIYLDGTLLTLFLLGLIAVVVWKKYSHPGYRLAATIPFGVSLLLGPLRDVTEYLFPKVGMLTEDIEYYGAINVEHRGVGIGLLQLFVCLSLSLLVLVSLILINDTLRDLVADVSLVLVGVGTGTMMGFSPTIYASEGRTFSTLTLCVMILLMHIYEKNRDTFALAFKKVNILYVEYAVILFSYLNLATLIMTQFYSQA